ncbi:MAG: thioredoxin family protein [Desulfurococcales archaeon]|nr:thioredoxin family protein [Desulfurococcales archaeon]
MEAYETYGVEGCDKLGRYLSSKDPVVIAFSSPTCGACAMYRPEFEYAKEQFPGVEFVWFNIVSCPNAAYQLGIPGTPTTIVVSKGDIKGAWIGAVPAEEVVKAVKKILEEEDS